MSGESYDPNLAVFAKGSPEMWELDYVQSACIHPSLVADVMRLTTSFTDEETDLRGQQTFYSHWEVRRNQAPSESKIGLAAAQ